MGVFKRPLLDICVWLECLTFMVFNHVALCEMPLAEWLDGVFWDCRLSNLLTATRGPAATGNVIPAVWMPHYWSIRKEDRWESAFTLCRWALECYDQTNVWKKEKKRKREERERSTAGMGKEIPEVMRLCSSPSLIVDHLKDIFYSKVNSCVEDPLWDV